MRLDGEANHHYRDTLLVRSHCHLMSRPYASYTWYEYKSRHSTSCADTQALDIYVENDGIYVTRQLVIVVGIPHDNSHGRQVVAFPASLNGLDLT